jgi:hypothetical protein
MSILSFSPSAAKGTSSTVTLNKEELYALAPISGDAFWSQPSNIKEVSVIYGSTSGSQTKAIKFDASLASPSSSISFSQSARDQFEIKFIILKDFDDGELNIGRSELSGLGLDISLVPQIQYLEWDVEWAEANPPHAVESDGGVYGSDWPIRPTAPFTSGLTAKDYTVKLANLSAVNSDIMVGFARAFSFGAGGAVSILFKANEDKLYLKKAFGTVDTEEEIPGINLSSVVLRVKIVPSNLIEIFVDGNLVFSINQVQALQVYSNILSNYGGLLVKPSIDQGSGIVEAYITS